MKFEQKRRPVLAGLIVLSLWAAFFAPGVWGLAQTAADSSLPEGFVYVDELVPGLVQEIRYAGSNNFMGRPADGYLANRAILTRAAAEALRKVQQELKEKGLGLKIFDAYRPTRAVAHFIRWAQDPADQKMKKEYYPALEKENLFKLGYLAKRSAHSRGSTVDLTLIYLATKEEVDMGSHFDFFGPISRYDSPLITVEQFQNRKLLREVMVKQGFVPYNEEWWHFRLKNEPYPNTYFDFVIQ